jgi:hypothetical protein
LAEYQFELVMQKPVSQRSKKEKVFVADLKTLRRVADDIKHLQAIIVSFMFVLDERNQGEERQNFNDFLKLNKLPLPDKLISESNPLVGFTSKRSNQKGD